jgi:hypothetical protein
MFKFIAQSLLLFKSLKGHWMVQERFYKGSGRTLMGSIKILEGHRKGAMMAQGGFLKGSGMGLGWLWKGTKGCKWGESNKIWCWNKRIYAVGLGV